VGLTDKLKDLGKQAQGVVAEHKDDIQNALGSVGSVANEKTHGKYAEKITRVGDKLSHTVEKISGAPAGNGTEAEAGQSTAVAEPPAAEEPTEAAPTEPAGDGPEFE